MGAAGAVSKARYHLTTEDIIKECGRDSDIAHKHILVTGATSGIGLETARALACAGAEVYLMGRDEAKLQGVFQNINNELQQKRSTGSIQSVVCDLNSLTSIKQFAQKFTRENKPLNLLILNAGLMNYNYEQTIDGLEQMIGVTILVMHI
jgi:dehydrogenase/reductase SDR family protein 12